MIFQWGPVPLSHISKYYLPYRACEEHTSLDSPVYHILPYVSGGLERLLHRIKTDAVPQLAGKNLFYRPPDKRVCEACVKWPLKNRQNKDLNDKW